MLEWASEHYSFKKINFQLLATSSTTRSRPQIHCFQPAFYLRNTGFFAVSNSQRMVLWTWKCTISCSNGRQVVEQVEKIGPAGQKQAWICDFRSNSLCNIHILHMVFFLGCAYGIHQFQSRVPFWCLFYSRMIVDVQFFQKTWLSTIGNFFHYSSQAPNLLLAASAFLSNFSIFGSL